MTAKKQRNDDPDLDAKSFDDAAQENVDPGIEPAPEESPETARVTQWDESPEARGSQAPRQATDMDENDLGDELVHDGVEAADRDSRLAANDPDYEP